MADDSEIASEDGDSEAASSKDGDSSPYSILDGIGLTARANLMFDAEERSVAKGELLIRLGDANDTMYILTTGTLEIHLDNLDEVPIAFIHPGEMVGELSLLDGSPASAHVLASEDCTVLAIGEEAFWSLTNTSHAFAVQLLVKLAQRLRANNTTVSKNVQKRRMYERAAMFDGLTGVHNRRWLDENLTRMVKRREKHAGALCASLVDIDHFKNFNDTYGHDAGDFVLTKVASTLAESLRPTDLVARFGGEEFVIIFPDTKLADAAKVADRVREAVASRSLDMPDGRTLPPVTISVGVAQLETGQSVPSLLKVADTAMYRAKRSGRNKVLTGTMADLETAR